MVDFLITYEHKARELENICLLKVELERRGYRVDIMHTQDLNRLRYLFAKKPKVILTHALYDNEDYYYHVNAIAGNILKVVNLQWEQVLSKEAYKKGFHNPKQKAALATHICWGKETFERLITSGVEHCVITGAIQMDFLKNKFEEYYYKKEEIMKMYNIRDKSIILYISSFTLANVSEDFKENLKKRTNYDIDELSEIMINTKIETLRWIEEILKKDTEKTIVYRPHPNESCDKDLERLENEYKNFRVIKDLSVKQWIKVAEKIFTWMSTSIVEVYFANKSCYVLRPQEHNENLDAVIYKDSKIIDNYNEFEETLTSEKSDKFPINESEIFKYYQIDNSKYSYEKICDLLEEVLTTNKYDLPSSEVKYRIHPKAIITPIVKSTIIRFRITKKTPIIRKNKKISNWLNLFWEARAKQEKDMAHSEEINTITEKIKIILEKENEKRD
ncbi:surface carbohydrate biosynthesis protein [Clostridium gasigenes]|uniref:surface carbohydrate biosynthesis protein n=1 Tax=Clostridium gasigenes TaxID=94869 RepID=UPI001C0DC988|nr:surface carbohydrate biosynthesis protein [Clostridium gasigenes]MBU3104460.1 hypothetical protein [Clostridium gasigenes]